MADQSASYFPLSLSQHFGLTDGYNPTVDYARFFAAAVIILFHAGAPGHVFGEAAVAFFTIAMCMFGLRSAEKTKNQALPALRKRAIRLLHPWLVWSAVYLAAKTAQAIISGQPVMGELHAWLPPTGSQSQLWYLPFAVVVTVFLAALTQICEIAIQSRKNWLLAIMACALCSAPLLHIYTYADLPLFFGLCVLYTPSVFMGVLFYAVRNDVEWIIKQALLLTGFGLVLKTLGLLGTQQLIIGAPITALVLLVKTPAFSFTKLLGDYAMNMYLVHILVISILWNVGPVAPDTLAGGVLAVVGTIAAAVALQRLPFRAYLG